MYNKSNLINKMEKVLLKNNLQIELEDYNENLSLLGIDSLVFIQLIIEIEQEFQIEIDDTDLSLENFLTINDFVSYIMENAKT